MAPKLPWMPFFGGDFYNDEAVRLMSLEEEAVYIRLLWWQWQEGSVPTDEQDLGKLAGGNVTARILAQFPVTRGGDGRRRNPRLDEIAKEQEAKNRKRSKAGKIGRRKQLQQVASEREPAGQSPGKRQPIAGQTPGESESESESDTKKTWLTSFANAWEARCGNPPHGRLARALAPLVRSLGEPEVSERWSRYLAGNEPRYCSPERFAATHQQYGGPQEQEMTDDFGRMVLHRKNEAGEWVPVVSIAS